MLFDICKQRGLDKVMLTAFKGTVYRNYLPPRRLLYYGSTKANKAAILFYESIGYVSLPEMPRPMLRSENAFQGSSWILLLPGTVRPFRLMTGMTTGKMKVEDM